MALLRPEFAVYNLTEKGLTAAAVIGVTFDDFLNDLEVLCGTDGRHMALVRTKLEEACFFAKKAMAERPGNSVS